MKKSRLLSVILVLMLCIGGLSGCQKSYTAKVGKHTTAVNGDPTILLIDEEIDLGDYDVIKNEELEGTTVTFDYFGTELTLTYHMTTLIGFRTYNSYSNRETPDDFQLEIALDEETGHLITYSRMPNEEGISPKETTPQARENVCRDFVKKHYLCDIEDWEYSEALSKDGTYNCTLTKIHHGRKSDQEFSFTLAPDGSVEVFMGFSKNDMDISYPDINDEKCYAAAEEKLLSAIMSQCEYNCVSQNYRYLEDGTLTYVYLFYVKRNVDLAESVKNPELDITDYDIQVPVFVTLD